jgi:hypothetical protein
VNYGAPEGREASIPQGALLAHSGQSAPGTSALGEQEVGTGGTVPHLLGCSCSLTIGMAGSIIARCWLLRLLSQPVSQSGSPP